MLYKYKTDIKTDIQKNKKTDKRSSNLKNNLKGIFQKFFGERFLICEDCFFLAKAVLISGFLFIFDFGILECPYFARGLISRPFGRFYSKTIPQNAKRLETLASGLKCDFLIFDDFGFTKKTPS